MFDSQNLPVLFPGDSWCGALSKGCDFQDADQWMEGRSRRALLPLLWDSSVRQMAVLKVANALQRET